MKKKECSLRNEELKANRVSETEERMKERLRIRCEKDRTRRRKKNTRRKEMLSATEDHDKERLVTLKRMKRGDENL